VEKLQEKTDNRLKRDSNWNNIFPEKARSCRNKSVMK
jgi:hypothetical protein